MSVSQMVSQTLSGIIAAVQAKFPATIRQLDYHLATDTFSNSNLTGAVWTDLHTAQNFTVSDANSLIEVIMRGCMNNGGGGVSGSELASAIIIDNTTRYAFNGADLATVATAICNGIAGGSVYITNPGVGTHTVKGQIFSSSSLTGGNYLRAATQPNIEFLHIQVIEHK